MESGSSETIRIFHMNRIQYISLTHTDKEMAKDADFMITEHGLVK